MVKDESDVLRLEEKDILIEGIKYEEYE